MTTTNDTNKTALADKAQRCFNDAFGGRILIFLLSDDRSPASGGTDEVLNAALCVDGMNDKPVVTLITSAERITEIKTQHPDNHNYCEWRASEQTLTRIFDGGRNLISAFISGRLAISGDMSIMARLQLSD